MNWIANLYHTYESNSNWIGVFQKKSNDQEYALLPICHSTQSAHVEVTLDETGEWITASVVDKSDSNTIIPATEDSSSRTSKPVPYPLFDKLMYVAGDYETYCSPYKSGNPYQDYIQQLTAWCESPYAHPKVRAVLSYLSRGTLIADLVRAGVLVLDETGKLAAKNTPALEEKHGGKPEIFKVIASEQSSAFVRFIVHVPGKTESRLWRDSSVHESFKSYYLSQLLDEDLCYVTGTKGPYADKHASRLRHSGDMTKLISANDTKGFTFRGRFHTGRQAASISYEVSQKAHSALKWLIERQGITIDDKVFLVWGTDSADTPNVMGDTSDLLSQMFADEQHDTSGDSTHQAFAGQVRKALNGYRYQGEYGSEVVIMILDGATGTNGRLSIVYYRDMDKNLFLDRLEQWHTSCSWLHRYRTDADKKQITFIGAPATCDIAFAVYGSKAGEKVVKELMERMLPCIIDGRSIPLDVIRGAVQRTSNPVAMEVGEWEKTLSITCALLRKHYEREGFELGLDVNNTDRNYLFGRLLAIADVLERSALDRDEKRATNAIRYMNAFAQRPERTWKTIQEAIQPYQARLGNQVLRYNKLLDEVGSKFRPEDFNNQSLTGLYLLGFYSQRHELYKSKQTREEEATAAAEAE